MRFLRILTGGVLSALLLSSAIEARADFISTTLGSAGPNNFAILTLNGSGDPHLNGPGTTNGNVGVSSGTLNLDGSAGPSVNGNVFLGDKASVTHPNLVTGTIFTNQSAPLLNGANTAVQNAITTFSNLAPTVTFSNGITGSTTINATPNANGVTVVKVGANGINLGNGTLTLNGPAGSQFVINDAGQLNLNSGKVALTGGLTASDVVFNLTGKDGVSTAGGLGNESVINGIVLAPTQSIQLSPGLINGELIAGGNNIQLASGASVNQVPPGPPSTPEPASMVLMGLGGAGLTLLAARRRERRNLVAGA